jgi:hypothetical protein
VDGESADTAQRHFAGLEQEIPSHDVSVRGSTRDPAS